MQGYELRQEAQALEQRIDALKRQNRDLTQDLDYYRSDQYIEKVAREELGLVKPGDVAVVMAAPRGPNPSSIATSAPAAEVAGEPGAQRSHLAAMAAPVRGTN